MRREKGLGGRLTFYLLRLTFFKMLNKMTTPATDNHILHALIPQRLVVQMVDVQMLFTSAQNALAIVMGEKLLPLNLP